MAISRAGAPVQSRPNYEGLIARAKQVPPGRTVVVHPCDETSLRGVAEAAASGIIVPILIGPAAKITATARQAPPSCRPRDAMDAILVVNAGSSSLKFQVFATDGATELRRLVKGQMDGIGTRWSRAALPEMILDRASTTGGPS